jgi:hypothetical protein
MYTTSSAEYGHQEVVSTKVWKLRRMWTTETSYEEKETVYDFQSSLYTRNNFDESPKQYIYTHPFTDSNWADEWSLGDIVPFRGCAYIVHFNTINSGSDQTTMSSSTAKQYVVERLRYDIMYNNVDMDLQNKIYTEEDHRWMV